MTKEIDYTAWTDQEIKDEYNKIKKGIGPLPLKLQLEVHKRKLTKSTKRDINSAMSW